MTVSLPLTFSDLDWFTPAVRKSKFVCKVFLKFFASQPSDLLNHVAPLKLKKCLCSKH